MARDLFRVGALRAQPTERVDAERGIIFGAKVIQLGAIKDDRPWLVDETTLSQVVQYINAPNKGLKARFTHPNLCDDGMGKYLGRWKNARLEGDAVVADLHLADSAKDTPAGNLFDYVLSLAQEAPDAFGVSVASILADEMSEQPDEGELMPLRFQGLRAADVVDEPAASSGLFDIGAPDALPAHATWLLEHYFGQADSAEVVARLSEFLSSYYGEKVMVDDITVDAPQEELSNQAEQQADQPAAQEVAADLGVQVNAAEGQQYIEFFGDRGARWYLEGKSLPECFAEHNAELIETVKQLELQNTELQQQLDAALLSGGESEPLSVEAEVQLSDRQKAALEKQQELKAKGVDESTAKWAAAFAANNVD